MKKYILKRLIQMIPVLFIISIIIFGIIKLTPGDPISSNIGPRATAEQKKIERQRLGLDKPLLIQYMKWLSRTLQGDFGQSIIYKKPVVLVISTFLWNTFMLNVVVFILSFCIAIPIGIHCAIKQHSKYDHFWTLFSLSGTSTPSFFFSLLLIFIFAVKLDFFPINGMITPGKDSIGVERFIDVVHHMMLPAAVLTLSSLAGFIRYIRTAVLEVVQQDYIRTAYAKGLNKKIIVYKHILRNALIPVVTLLGYNLTGLFSGAVLLESIFVWPGIGNLFYESINARDYNLMMALMMFFSLLTLLGNLLADIGYAVVDPRITLE